MLVDASHIGKAGYLPGFATQKETIASLFPKAHIIDSLNTDWSTTQAWLRSSQLFHYMGHGRPDGTGTSLDYDAHRSLRTYDFPANLLGKTELVVLAACSGAAGREYGIADTGNLVRVFLQAGVPSVVASHWNVDAASTSRLMENFYLHLAKKESVALAMYNARISMLHANPHPYFWAGFRLSGRAG
jgi:CHAT domain-containing protein